MSDRRTFLRQLGLGIPSLALLGCAPTIKYNIREAPKNSHFADILNGLRSLQVPWEESFTFYNSGTDRVVIFSPDIHIDEYAAEQNKRLAGVLQHLPVDEVFLEGLEGKLAAEHLATAQKGLQHFDNEVERRRREILDAITLKFNDLKNVFVKDWTSVDDFETRSNFAYIIFEASSVLYQLGEQLSQEAAFLSHGIGAPGHSYLEIALQYGKGKGLERKQLYFNEVSLSFAQSNAHSIDSLDKFEAKFSQAWHKFKDKVDKDTSCYKVALEVRELINGISTQLKSEFKDMDKVFPRYITPEQMFGADRNISWIETMNATPGDLFYVIAGLGHSCFFREIAPAIDASLVTLQPAMPLEDQHRKMMQAAFGNYCLQARSGAYDHVFPVTSLK